LAVGETSRDPGCSYRHRNGGSRIVQRSDGRASAGYRARRAADHRSCCGGVLPKPGASEALVCRAVNARRFCIIAIARSTALQPCFCACALIYSLHSQNSIAVHGIDFWGTSMFKGFREFIMRGSVVELAVGVVMGAAFGAVVTGFVKDLLTPLIAAIAGKPDFSAYAFVINGSKFLVGDFLNVFISFLLISLAVYFFVVIPVNHMMTRFNLNAPAAKKVCPECQSEI